MLLTRDLCASQVSFFIFLFFKNIKLLSIREDCYRVWSSWCKLANLKVRSVNYACTISSMGNNIKIISQ